MLFSFFKSQRLILGAVFGCVFLLPGMSDAANPSGDLRIETLAAHNLAVVKGGYSPRSIFLGAKFCNDGTNDLTGVYAYIGDYKGGVSNTPGIYPTNKVATLTGPLTDGTFALTHEGGGLGLSDASRYIGTIPPGESVVVFGWLVIH